MYLGLVCMASDYLSSVNIHPCSLPRRFDVLYEAAKHIHAILSVCVLPPGFHMNVFIILGCLLPHRVYPKTNLRTIWTRRAYETPILCKIRIHFAIRPISEVSEDSYAILSPILPFNLPFHPFSLPFHRLSRNIDCTTQALNAMWIFCHASRHWHCLRFFLTFVPTRIT